MTRKHYDSVKLRRYARRKIIRRSLAYRLRRWARRAAPRIDTISGFVRIWLLLTLAAYFVAVWLRGPGSGLLPSPWDRIVGWIVGAVVTGWQAWSVLSNGVEKGQKPERESG